MENWEIVNGEDEVIENIEELVDEKFKKGEVVIHNKKGERFGNKLVLASGLGLAGYVLYKIIIKPRIDKKRRTQDEQIQMLKQLLLESIEKEK